MGERESGEKKKPPSLEQAAEALQVYKGQLGQMASQVEVLQTSVREVEKAISTISALKEAKEEPEILVPVGGGCFIFAKVQDLKTVLVPLGRDIAAKMTVEKALEKLEERKKEISDLLEKSNAEMSKLDKQVMQLQQYVEMLYNQQQMGGGRRSYSSGQKGGDEEDDCEECGGGGCSSCSSLHRD